MSKETYLGEVLFDQKDTPFKDYGPNEWALWHIMQYGSIDGGHHKAWVLDQVARCLKGATMIINQASWSTGETNWRIDTGEPTQEYLDWVAEVKDGEDGPETYGYDEGCPP